MTASTAQIDQGPHHLLAPQFEQSGLDADVHGDARQQVRHLAVGERITQDEQPEQGAGGARPRA